MHQAKLAPESPQFVNRQPDVRKPDPRNRAAHEIVLDDARDPGVVVDEEVFAPQRDPGEDEEQDSHLEADNNVQDGQQTGHFDARGVRHEWRADRRSQRASYLHLWRPRRLGANRLGSRRRWPAANSGWRSTGSFGATGGFF